MKRAIFTAIILAFFMIVFCGCHKRSTESDSQVPTHVGDAQNTAFESPEPIDNSAQTDNGGDVEAGNDASAAEEDHAGKSESVAENADGISTEISSRKPFKYTVVTDQYEDTEILVFVDAVSGQYPVKYDLDCESDGVYEFTELTENHSCIYKQDSGKHQISVRGDIPAMHLCSIEPELCLGKECGDRNAALFRKNPVISELPA